MKDLPEIRKEIDTIDRQIVELYEKRMQLTAAVAEYKIAAQKEVFDAERENAKLESAAALTRDDANRKGAKDLFGHLMALSRKQQYRMLDEHGCLPDTGFGILEDKEISKTGHPAHPLRLYRDRMEAWQALETGQERFLLLDTEENGSGSENLLYHQLLEHGCYILAKIQRERTCFVIGKEPVHVRGADRLLLSVETREGSASIGTLLHHFCYNHIEVLRIDSEAMRDTETADRFYFEIRGHLEDSAVQNLTGGLKADAGRFQILGYYRFLIER